MHRTDAIGDYVDEVASSLRLPRRARLNALADLRGGLRAAALDVGVEEAIHSFGPAQSTATRLDAEYGEPGRRSWLPFGLSPRTLADRARAAVDPAGPWFVPRVVGIGWDLNFGRVARALGLVGFDDLDEDVGRAVPAGVWGWSLAAVSIPVGLAATITASGLSAMRTAPAHWPLLGPANRWAPADVAFAPALGFAAAAEALALAALWARSGLPVRLALVGFAAGGATMALGIAVMTRWQAAAPGVLSLAVLACGAAAGGSLVAAVVRSGRSRVLAR